MDPPCCLFTPTQKETSRPAARRDWSQMDLEVLGVPQRGGHSLLCRWEEGSSPLPGQQGTFKWCARLWLPQGSQPLLEVCRQRLSSSCLQVVAAGENPPSCCKTKITGDTTEARQQRGMRGPPDTGFPGLPQAAHSPCLMIETRHGDLAPPWSMGQPGTDGQVGHCTRTPPQGADHIIVIVDRYLFVWFSPDGAVKSLPCSD